MMSILRLSWDWKPQMYIERRSNTSSLEHNRGDKLELKTLFHQDTCFLVPRYFLED